MKYIFQKPVYQNIYTIKECYRSVYGDDYTVGKSIYPEYELKHKEKGVYREKELKEYETFYETYDEIAEGFEVNEKMCVEDEIVIIKEIIKGIDKKIYRVYNDDKNNKENEEIVIDNEKQKEDIINQYKELIQREQLENEQRIKLEVDKEFKELQKKNRKCWWKFWK